MKLSFFSFTFIVRFLVSLFYGLSENTASLQITCIDHCRRITALLTLALSTLGASFRLSRYQ